MKYEFIQVTGDGPVGQVRLNRPKVRNAQSRRLLEEMDDAFAVLSRDKAVKVILLTAAGDHFCAGHDLGSREELADQEHRPIDPGVRGRDERSQLIYVDYTLRWRDLPKPTIAVVQGYCIFAGWMVASAMDMIFAADDAMFLGTNFQYFSIPWDIHPRQAKELLFESRFINGEEAKDLGLVNRTYPREILLQEATAYALRVAKNDSFQLRMIKRAVNQAQDTQGFHAHIQAAHGMHILSATGEGDPGYEVQKPGGKRRPMVQQAIENYEAHRKDDAQQ